MTDDEVELALERKAIEVEHWDDQQAAQAAWEYYRAELEKKLLKVKISIDT